MPNTNPSNVPAGLAARRLQLDEPINVWFTVGDLEHLDDVRDAFALAPRSGRVTSILRLRDWTATERALLGGQALGDRIVLVASDADRRRWGHMSAADLRAIADLPPWQTLLVEPDPYHAVVASMQWLRPHDTLLAAWHDSDDSVLARLLRRGAHLRGALNSLTTC